LELPVVQAGMGGGLAGHQLAKAVSAAGGLGTIGFLAPDQLRAEVAAARRLTDGPLAVNLLLPFARRAHFEAGGHVRGTVPAAELLTRVREALPDDYPVRSAGGIADRDDVKGRMAAGAVAAVCGTRFLMRHESGAHPAYKARLVEADETVLTELFGAGWPAPTAWCRTGRCSVRSRRRVAAPRPWSRRTPFTRACASTASATSALRPS
jgi:nitronate monooxygenase